jgi:PIN domain nuclease of toxin-antitoxin system
VRLLLDTHLLLWAVADAGRLSSTTRRAVEDPGNEVYYSAASLWEIAIKRGLRREDFQVDLALVLRALPGMGMTELAVRALHAVAVTELPPVHRDPFDRLLVAQSIVEPMVLLTNDAVLERYGSTVRVV